MRASTIASVLALAASSTAQFNNQTAPFALVILSGNSTYNGTTLAACHEGAAIEGLCIGATLGSPVPHVTQTFTFNYSSSNTIEPNIGTVGYLAYRLNGTGFSVSEPLELAYNPTSNVAVPLFTPSESGTEIAFKDDDLLGIPGFIDDTVYPANVDSPQTYYRFYICETYAGYAYTTLAWAMGRYPPENPSCVKAQIKRVFV